MWSLWQDSTTGYPYADKDAPILRHKFFNEKTQEAKFVRSSKKYTLLRSDPASALVCALIYNVRSGTSCQCFWSTVHARSRAAYYGVGLFLWNRVTMATSDERLEQLEWSLQQAGSALLAANFRIATLESAAGAATTPTATTAPSASMVDMRVLGKPFAGDEAS